MLSLKVSSQDSKYWKKIIILREFHPYNTILYVKKKIK